MNDKILILKDINYKDIFNKYNNKFIIIDFFAEWCLPCKKMISVFNKLSLDKSLINCIFCSVNIDNNSLLTKNFNIKSIPTFNVIYSSKIIGTKTGILNLFEFKKFIDNLIYDFNKIN